MSRWIVLKYTERQGFSGSPKKLLNESTSSKYKPITKTIRRFSYLKPTNCIIHRNNLHSSVRVCPFLKKDSTVTTDKKYLSCSGDSGDLVGLVLGVYTRGDDPYGTTKIFTRYTDEYDKRIGHKVADILDTTGPIPKQGETKILYKLDPAYSAIIVTGIGDECAGYNELEQMDEKKENIRGAVSKAVRLLQELNMKTIFIDGMENAESVAEGAALGVWRFQELKNPSKQRLIPRIELHGDCDYTGWQIGLQKAAAQNIARQLCETPANILNPLAFAQAAVEVLCKAKISVEVKVSEWAKIQKMYGFLAAASGSCEPPVFLEISYFGCDPDVAPALLIGKSVTFDSGGICLKKCDAMQNMRGDMAGGAVIVGAVRAAAALQLPINIRGLLPVYEHMPGTCAMKPGDIIKVRSGKTVLIHSTDYDGRLSIADALSYSQTYNPKFVMDIGTYCRELEDSLGLGAGIATSNNDSLFETLKNAAVHTGDRICRLPLWAHYSKKVNKHPSADVQDREIRSGIPCTCAAFLREFAPAGDWIHLDINNIMWSDGVVQVYLSKGMSGRPTRTLIEFLAQLACKGDSEEKENETAKKT